VVLAGGIVLPKPARKIVRGRGARVSGGPRDGAADRDVEGPGVGERRASKRSVPAGERVNAGRRGESRVRPALTADIAVNAGSGARSSARPALTGGSVRSRARGRAPTLAFAALDA
jgi:hypothetical protein